MGGVTDLLRIFGDERYMLAYTERKKKRKADRGGGGRAQAQAQAGGKDGGVADRGIVSVILHRDATGADTVKSLLALEYFQEELKRAGFKVVGAPPPAATPASRNASKATGVNGDSAASAAAAAPAVAAAPGVPPLTVVAAEGRGTQPASGVTPGAVGGAPLLPNSNEAAPVPLRAGEGREEERRHPSAAELRRCLEAARRRADEGAPGFFAALEVLGWSTEKFMFGNIKSRVEWRL